MQNLAILMHKNIETLKFIMNEDGICIKIQEILNEEHLPPALRNLNDVHDINYWLSQRRLAKDRPDVMTLQALHYLKDLCFYPLHYLSLYDCYWIKYEGETCTWASLSLYATPFREDIFSMYEMLGDEQDYSRDTANLTIPGRYPITCSMDDQNHFLFSMRISPRDRSAYLQNIYQDYIPTIIGKYTLNGAILSYDFVNITDENIEYIPYQALYDNYRETHRAYDKEEEEVFFESLEYYQIPDGVDFVTKMIALDSKYQVPRELSDFGVLRNANTLKMISFCPIFLYPDKQQAA